MDELKLALREAGFKAEAVQAFCSLLEGFILKGRVQEGWQTLSQALLERKTPFDCHLALYKHLYPDWENSPAPAWFPQPEEAQMTQLGQWMLEKGYTQATRDYPYFHAWSIKDYPLFWQEMVKRLNLSFDQPYQKIVDLSAGIESPQWFPGAKMNITRSCFQAKPSAIALRYQDEKGQMTKLSYQALDQLSNQVANSLKPYLKSKERAAIIMPMTIEAVAIFLGLIKSGCVVVAIPDSFSAEEIATRLRISETQLVFTQDMIIRAGKQHPLYEKILKAEAPLTIILPTAEASSLKARESDLKWEDFLSENKSFEAESMSPDDAINILFSSGTTGDPKAIPWLQTTPIKCASDAYLHHNLQSGDVLCWPSNLGWMMGPWQIFACLLNQATLAIYNDTPNERSFGEFIQKAAVTHLGVVPTLVRNWRHIACMEGLDWSQIKLFTSTGERSNGDDMLYLMWLANYRPIIEYCGGTEIGGAYITSTLVQPNVPAAFSTAALGLDFVLLDEKGKPSDRGEVAIIPPSLGLSTELLNKSHHEVYYAQMPSLDDGRPLRRHGDQFLRYQGYYRSLGRMDDTMKLGGIKISSAEIETLLSALEGIEETAAIAFDPPDGSPSRLVIYAVLTTDDSADKTSLQGLMQQAISQRLNPLFKIHELILRPSLPRTASNKVMRRLLRDEYLTQYKDSLTHGSN